MMMVPYMFHDALLDDWFQNDWDRDFDRMMEAADPRRAFGKRSANVMKTDVRETENGYDVFVDLPGFKKEDVKLDLQNGYLTITANRTADHDEKDGQGPLHPSGAVHRFLRPQLLCGRRAEARGREGQL